MKMVAQMEVSIQVIHKHGLYYAQIFDCESMNLIWEEECLTRQGAAARIGSFLCENIEKEMSNVPL